MSMQKSNKKCEICGNMAKYFGIYTEEFTGNVSLCLNKDCRTKLIKDRTATNNLNRMMWIKSLHNLPQFKIHEPNQMEYCDEETNES